jgi:hypothetical protein
LTRTGDPKPRDGIAFRHVELQETVLSVNLETARIGTLTIEARHGIALLRERRAALISAAVTGKIDVRGLVQQEAA